MSARTPKAPTTLRSLAPESGGPVEIAAQSVLLSDLTLSCRIGVTEEERAERQRLRFNITLEVRPKAPREDKITEVVDYGPLVAKIHEVCAQVEFRLLESLAEQIAIACFFDVRVLCARVRVVKLDRYTDVGGIGCEFEYRRKDI